MREKEERKRKGITVYTTHGERKVREEGKFTEIKSRRRIH